MTDDAFDARQRILELRLLANQRRLLALSKQGPDIVAAVIAAVNGGIGGQIGLERDE